MGGLLQLGVGYFSRVYGHIGGLLQGGLLQGYIQQVLGGLLQVTANVDLRSFYCDKACSLTIEHILEDVSHPRTSVSYLYHDLLYGKHQSCLFSKLLCRERAQPRRRRRERQGARGGEARGRSGRARLTHRLDLPSHVRLPRAPTAAHRHPPSSFLALAPCPPG